MKTLTRIALFFPLMGPAVSPRPAAAQATAADTAAVLYQIAERLTVTGDTALAQDLLRFILRQYPGTPAADFATQRVTELHGAREATSGRVELMVWGVTEGAFLGIMVPLALGAESPEPFGAGLLIGAPVGFAAARAFGRSGPLSLGQARIIRFASMWGGFQAVGWREVLDIGDTEQTFCDPTFGCQTFTQESERAPYTATVVGTLVGIGAGAALARSREISAGTAAVVEMGTLWGTWFGVSSGVVLNVDENEDGLLTHTLLAGNVALVTAALAAPKVNISVGRARLISVAGVGGLIVGLGLALLSDVEDEGVGFGIPMVTSAAGLVAGAAATRNYDGEAGSGAPGAPGAALLNLRDGRLSVGAPVPLPTVMRTLPRADGRPGWAPGVRLSLLEARF